MKHIGEQAKRLKRSLVAMFAMSDNRSAYAHLFLCSWGKQNKNDLALWTVIKSVIFYLRIVQYISV